MSQKDIIFMCILVMHFFGNQIHAMGSAMRQSTHKTSYNMGFSAHSMKKINRFGNALFYIYHFHNVIDNVFVPLVKDVEDQVRVQFLTKNAIQDAITLLRLKLTSQYSHSLGEKIMNIARQYENSNVTLDIASEDKIHITQGQQLGTFMESPSVLGASFNDLFVYKWLETITNWAFVSNPMFRGKKIFYPGLLLFLLGIIQYIEDIHVQVHDAKIGFNRSQLKILKDALKDLFAKTVAFYKDAFEKYQLGEANEGWWKYTRYAKNIVSVPSFGKLPEWKSLPQVPDLVNELRPGVALHHHFSSSPVNYIRDTALIEHSFYQKWLQKIFSKKGLAIAGAAGIGAGAYMFGRKYAPSQLGQAAKDVAMRAIGVIPRGIKRAYNWAQKANISPDELKALQDSAVRAKELEIALKNQERARMVRALQQPQPKLERKPAEKQSWLEEQKKKLWEKRPTWLGGSGSKAPPTGTSGVWERLKRLASQNPNNK